MLAKAALKASRLALLASRLARSRAKEERAEAAAAALGLAALLATLLRPAALLRGAVVASLVRWVAMRRMESAEGRTRIMSRECCRGLSSLGRRSPHAPEASVSARERVPRLSRSSRLTVLAEADSQALKLSFSCGDGATRGGDTRSWVHAARNWQPNSPRTTRETASGGSPP